jgi:hypothetical protein
MSASKSDRSTSPAAASEDSRRDLLARQHRALYGNESPAFFPPGPLDDNSRPDSQGQGHASPAVDPFGLAGDANASANSPTHPQPTSSPSSAVAVSAPSPTDSPRAMSGSGSGPVGPIGSRVGQPSPPSNPALNKRSITPLPSPLGLGFKPTDSAPTERTSSAGPAPVVTSTAPAKEPVGGAGLGWSNGSGVWGSKSGLGVPASVWG